LAPSCGYALEALDASAGLPSASGANSRTLAGNFDVGFTSEFPGHRDGTSGHGGDHGRGHRGGDHASLVARL
jgi:hypothetical protein